MDYLKTYNYFYNKTKRIASDKILLTLKLGREDERNFYKIDKEICETIRLLIDDIYIKRIIKNHSIAYEQFKSRELEFSGKNIVFKILNNHVLKAYNKDKVASDFYSNYNELIVDLAKEESLSDALQSFKYSKKLYALMYKRNDFVGFELKIYDIGFENTDIYRKLNSENESKSDLNNLKNNPVILNDKTLTAKEIDLNYRISIFSEDEKLLLMHIYFNKPKIPKTELLKASRLAQIDDTSLFNKDTSNNTTYNKFVKGLDYYDNVKTKRDLIDALIDNIKGFGLNKITEYLKIERRKIR